MQQRDTEKGFLLRKLKDLERSLDKCVDATLQDLTETLGEQIFAKFVPAIHAASSDAVPTATKWGAKRDQGGLHFQTYKATIRRNGVFQVSAGLRDFNREL